MILMPEIELEHIAWGEEIILPTSRGLSVTPHFVGARYPCRSIAYVPNLILRHFNSELGDISVLDPFMGSGTTAIEATKYAAKIFGVEIDPYARKIADVSTKFYTDNEIRSFRNYREKIINVARNTQPDASLAPNLNNIEYWFDKKNYNELLRIKTAIHSVCHRNITKDFFLIVLADIIRATSKAERQSLKPYISRKYIKTPKPALPEFVRISEKYINAVTGQWQINTSNINWLGEDATNFSSSEKIDLAITSPPYINAIDYTRCIKLESAWIGTANDDTIKKIRNSQVGESVRRHVMTANDVVEEVCSGYFAGLEFIDRTRFDTALAYFKDMHSNLNCVYNALNDDGLYFLIIGNSKIRGISIETHDIITKIAEKIGFALEYYFFYKIKDRRTSIPRGDNGGIIEVEHVIGLRK